MGKTGPTLRICVCFMPMLSCRWRTRPTEVPLLSGVHIDAHDEDAWSSEDEDEKAHALGGDELLSLSDLDLDDLL